MRDVRRCLQQETGSASDLDWIRRWGRERTIRRLRYWDAWPLSAHDVQCQGNRILFSENLPPEPAAAAASVASGSSAAAAADSCCSSQPQQPLSQKQRLRHFASWRVPTLIAHFSRRRSLVTSYSRCSRQRVCILPSMPRLQGFSALSRFTAILRSSAKLSGPLPRRIRQRSSSKAMSKTQCRLFSTHQCSTAHQRRICHKTGDVVASLDARDLTHCVVTRNAGW